jgi:tetratricopeptide (TPR) repeat protein
MKIVSTLALAFALAGLSVGSPAIAAKEKKEQPAKKNYSKAAQTPLAAAQKALEANDAATAATELEKAKAVLSTPDDKYAAGSLYYRLSQTTKDQAQQAQGIDLMIESGQADPGTVSQLYIAQAQVAWDKKDYAKVEQALTAAQQAGSTNNDIVPMLVMAQANQGQTMKALQTVNAQIDRVVAAGQTPPAEWYERGVDLGYRAKAASPADQAAINAATVETTKKWVAAYPTKKNWNTALRVFTDRANLDTDAQTDVFRLLRHANALSGDIDYREYALNVYLRFPNEAMTVLQEGNSKGVVNLTGKNDATDVMNTVKPKIAADKGSLPQSDKGARAAANGRAALNTADAYVSYGEYAKAVELYKLALEKGGVDANVANLRLGAALAQQGDAAGAKAAFAQVQGPRKPIADFWTIHLDHPTTEA